MTFLSNSSVYEMICSIGLIDFFPILAGSLCLEFCHFTDMSGSFKTLKADKLNPEFR
jgi:hypothetical protein